MNHLVKEQLVRYTGEFDALIATLDPETVFHRPALGVKDTPQRRRRRRLPAWATAVLAGLLIGVVVGALPWLFPNPNQPDQVDKVPSQLFNEWTQVEGPIAARRTARGLSTGEKEFVYCTETSLAVSANGLDWEYLAGSGQFNLSCMYWEGVVVTVKGGGASQPEGGPYVAYPSLVVVGDAEGSSEFRIDGDVMTVAIGGQGILVSATDTRFDPMVILSRETGLDLADLESTNIVSGVLVATFADGSTQRIDLAQVGIDPEDVGKTVWWFSDYGSEWSQLSADTGVTAFETIGSAEGFYAIGGDSRAWFTVDGRAWEDLGKVEGFKLRTVAGRPVVVGPKGITRLDQRPPVETPFGDLPERGFPLVAGEKSALVWGRESDGTPKLWYAEYGQPFQPEDLPPEMRALKSDYGPYGGVVGNRYLLLIFDANGNPTYWLKDY